MNTVKKIAGLFLVLVCISTNSIAQAGPPPPLEPTKAQKLLIDDLLTASGFEDYYKEYCEDLIGKKSWEKNWDKTKIAALKNKINFSAFKEYTLYNFYATFTEEELRSNHPPFLSHMQKTWVESATFFSSVTGYWGKHWKSTRKLF